MFEKIRSFIADDLSIEEEDIKPESNFKDDLDADSLDIFNLCMTLEEEFNVEIPSEDLEKITTVQTLIDYLKTIGIEE